MINAVEFDAQVKCGTIEIPLAHRALVSGAVHVIVYPQEPSITSTKIDELLANPLPIAAFEPLSREQAHERG